MSKFHKCPTCRGKKQVRCEVHEGRKISHVDLGCVSCDGTGKVTAAQLNAIKRAREIWCRCDESSGSAYHPDAAGVKHHWTCNDCGKVTQIG